MCVSVRACVEKESWKCNNSACRVLLCVCVCECSVCGLWKDSPVKHLQQAVVTIINFCLQRGSQHRGNLPSLSGHPICDTCREGGLVFSKYCREAGGTIGSLIEQLRTPFPVVDKVFSQVNTQVVLK